MWRDFYKLLEKYNGDLDPATEDELARAAINGSDVSRRIAEIHYSRVHRHDKTLFAKTADDY